MTSELSRRDALRALSLSAAGTSLLAPSASAQEAAPAAAENPAGICVLLPQAVEGPYYFDPKLVRADISEGKEGAPVELKLRVVDAKSCQPITGIRVDVWHADAGGIYSGYDRQGDDRTLSTKGQTYLRGTLMTDADGIATFRTIYPGWYPGRTPHIHVKAFLDKATLVTGQIYFPDELSARVYSERLPYSKRPVPDTTNARDGIFRAGEAEGGGTVLAVSEAGDAINAALLIGVDQTGEAAKKGGGFGGFFRRIIGG
ncbi:MAG TPA: intradiol ring-cleavage dioxygenase [Hyphomicrobium sp.]|nr:intradiol ring-cleavage dioxygenase [Hyphomicrobium sp.]